MMFTCHVQIVSLQKGFKTQPLPLDLCIHSVCYVFATREKRRDRYQVLLTPPIQRRKKISAFINTTLVLTGWSLLTLMSLKSYLQRTSVKAEVRYASALNPLALNPAKLSHSFF